MVVECCNTNFTVPVTYANGLSGVPLDVNGVSLHDVLHLQSNFQYADSSRVTPDLQNEEY